jgi:hypothetical protein
MMKRGRGPREMAAVAARVLSFLYLILLPALYSL